MLAHLKTFMGFLDGLDHPVLTVKRQGERADEIILIASYFNTKLTYWRSNTDDCKEKALKVFVASHGLDQQCRKSPYLSERDTSAIDV